MCVCVCLKPTTIFPLLHFSFVFLVIDAMFHLIPFLPFSAFPPPTKWVGLLIYGYFFNQFLLNRSISHFLSLPLSPFTSSIVSDSPLMLSLSAPLSPGQVARRPTRIIVRWLDIHNVRRFNFMNTMTDRGLYLNSHSSTYTQSGDLNTIILPRMRFEGLLATPPSLGK